MTIVNIFKKFLLSSKRGILPLLRSITLCTLYAQSNLLIFSEIFNDDNDRQLTLFLVPKWDNLSYTGSKSQYPNPHYGKHKLSETLQNDRTL